MAGWRDGRATFFGGPASFTDAYLGRWVGAFGDVIYGSCGYFETREGVPQPEVQDIPFGQVYVAALADYPGSCGRCYEVRCKPGIVIGNTTAPLHVDLQSPDYLAGVNSTVKDTYGRSFPGNAAEAQSEQDVICWAGSTLSPGATNNSADAGLNAASADNSGSIVLAHPVYGEIGLQFRPVDCYSHRPFTYTSLPNSPTANLTGSPSSDFDFAADNNPTSMFNDTREGQDVPYLVNTVGFLPGYINYTIYGDMVETGWGWSPFYLHSSEFWRKGAGVNGSNATCINVATKAQYNKGGSGGGGLTLSCRNCSAAGYQPFGANNQLQFWVRSNSSGDAADPRESAYPRGSIPDLSLYLNNQELGQGCSASPRLLEIPQYQDKVENSTLGTYYHFGVPLAVFSCEDSPLNGTAAAKTINFISESNQDYGSFCLDEIRLVNSSA
ncbi:hypothetical protein WJX72_001303 [[Myrmecia] bisecta]|uniref:Expansin-like EG45 domain-containing protein n=1 Tax=[Myrmecia] bisecta TaxID=41462 RepID=A0AAW1PCF5_9CHLO